MLTRLRPVSPTNKAISPNPLHRFSPARYPKMLANISEEEVRTDMLEVFVKGDNDLFSERMVPRKERRM